jgi:TrmH RNA methyltransferase
MNKPQKKTHPTTKTEIKVYGINAVKAVYKNRPQDIIKLVLTKEQAPHFSDLLSYLAKNKKGYNLETASEIAKFANSVHHEGVCLLVKNLRQPLLKEWFEKSKNKKQILILALENIDNPHNLGAIIRTASHFAVDALFYTSKSTTHLDPSVNRVAQGGSEYVPIFKLTDWNELLEFCQKQKISVFTTSDRAKNSVNINTFTDKTMVVLGNEGQGLSPLWKTFKTTEIKIAGTNKVESLNISVANGILLSFYRHNNHLPPLD